MAPGSISIECQEEGKSKEEGERRGHTRSPSSGQTDAHDSDTSQKKFPPPPPPVCSENVLLRRRRHNLLGSLRPSRRGGKNLGSEEEYRLRKKSRSGPSGRGRGKEENSGLCSAAWHVAHLGMNGGRHSTSNGDGSWTDPTTPTTSLFPSPSPGRNKKRKLLPSSLFFRPSASSPSPSSSYPAN